MIVLDVIFCVFRKTFNFGILSYQGSHAAALKKTISKRKAIAPKNVEYFAFNFALHYAFLRMVDSVGVPAALRECD